MNIEQSDISKKSNQVQWINYAKGIAIILIVYRHSLTGMTAAGISVNNYFITANEVVLSFRMPLFFIISGFFFSNSFVKKGFLNFTKSRAFTILYPYFIWGGLQIGIQILLSAYTNKSKSVHDFLNLIISPRSVDQFWYLYTLFAVTLLYSIFHLIFKGNKILQLLTGVVFYGFINLLAKAELPWLIANFYIYFALGDYMADYIFKKETFKLFSSRKILFIILPIFVAAQITWMVQINLPIFLKLIIALIGCLFTIILSFRLDKLNILKYLIIIGQYSLPIYLIHILIISGIRIGLNKILGYANAYAMLPLCVILGIILPIIFYRITVKKLGFYWLFSLEKPTNNK